MAGVELQAGDLPQGFGGNVVGGLWVFLIVFLTFFPVIIPFALWSDHFLALRISNLIAIVMMFSLGWSGPALPGLVCSRQGSA
jgi:hypothetical protein